MATCDHWDGLAFCAAEPSRHYLPGMRCAEHTPAALAGHSEPGRTATSLPQMAPLPQSAGKRRSTPERFREAQADAAAAARRAKL